jgi:tRNA threonylcarbamoyl adenosine modification protein YeaZ
LRLGISLKNGLLSESAIADRFKYSESIFPQIASLLERNGLTVESLNGVIVCSGPGSFTGLRVGMAAAKGIAVAGKIPLVGISIFSSLAARLFSEYGPTAVVIRSRKDEYYLGLLDETSFDDRRVIIAKESEIIGLIGSRAILAVDGALPLSPAFYGKLIRDEKAQPTLRDLYIAGHEKFLKSGDDDVARLQPLYIQKFSPPRKV